MPVITLPDGSQRRFDQPVTVAQLAASIGAGLAKAALAGRVDGKLVDTSHLIDRDASVSVVTGKDPEGLEIIRHSTAHLLAQAVQAVYPEAQVTIGPVVEDGFYYDFAFSRPFTPDDLAKFEAKMHELAKADLEVERKVMPRDAAVETFKKLGGTTRPRSSRASRQAKTSAFTGRATGSTSAAARTCPAPASSARSS
jgi:threonyl-tRNA synthetase